MPACTPSTARLSSSRVVWLMLMLLPQASNFTPLPWAPLHPVRTMINLHHYNGALHSFRHYNFSGQVAHEPCEGKLDGQAVRISLDGSDINEKATATPAHKACFDGIATDWAQYKIPR